MLRRSLLACGVLSSLLYVAIDALAALRYPAYHSYVSQAISELGAVGAPTQRLVHPLFVAYGVLLLAFAAGVWAWADGWRAPRVVAGMLAGIAVVGLVTPPMHLRGTSGVAGDFPHIALTGVIVLCILSAMAVGSSLFGRRWRRYSLATTAVLVLTFVATGAEAGRLAAGRPTPWLGLVERINIYGYLLWVAALAVGMLRAGVRPVPLGRRTQPPVTASRMPAPG